MLGTCERCLARPTVAASRPSAAMPGRKQLTGRCSSRRCGMGCRKSSILIGLTNLYQEQDLAWQQTQDQDLELIWEPELAWILDLDPELVLDRHLDQDPSTY